MEVFVNGQRVNQTEVPPGRFQFDNLLLPSGSGSTKVVTGKYPANVDYEGGICNFELTIPQSQEQMVNLGNLKCTIP